MNARLHGRDLVFEKVRLLMGAAAAGEGGSVAVIGAPGSGRTSVLAAAASEAVDAGWVLRRAAGRASERHLEGALVHELFGTPVSEPVAVAEHMRSLAGEQPCLVAVDDLHLADAPSLAAVVYAARRLVGARVAVLLALGDDHGIDLAGVDRIELDGLDEGAVAEVFAELAGPLAPAALARVMHLTAGNPLAVADMARRSTPEQRDGTHPFADLPEVSEALVRAFAEPLASLPDATRRALCVAAAEPSGRLDLVAGALVALGETVDHLEAAEAVGVIRLGEGRVVFDHPMRRVVAYASLALASRRAAHRALASACSSPGDAVDRVRHLVAGAVGPDDGLADDVQLVAEHLDRSGRVHEARVAWQAAASLSVDPVRRQRREAKAAQEPEPTEATHDAGPLSMLSPAERKVAVVVAEGLTNKQVAERLFVSVKTVDAHLQSIFRKLQVNTRAQLAVTVARAVR